MFKLNKCHKIYFLASGREAEGVSLENWNSKMESKVQILSRPKIFLTSIAQLVERNVVAVYIWVQVPLLAKKQLTRIILYN